MPMLWRRIIDTAAFVLAVAIALCIRYGLEWSWYTAVGVAVIVFILTPFIVSRMWAKRIVRRMERVAKELGFE